MSQKNKNRGTSNHTRRSGLVVLKSAPAVFPNFSAGEIATRERGLGFSLVDGMPLPNPDPVLKKMGKDITVYNDLLSDAFVGGCADSRSAGVLSLSWAVDKNKAQGRSAAFCQDILQRLNMPRLISEILSAPLFGYEVGEAVWQVRADNMVVPVSLQKKPNDWFAFDGHERLLFRSRQNPMGENIPPRKFLLATHKASWENPYGLAVLSRVFWPAAFKKGGLKFWTVFTEKYGMPHVVGKLPRGTGDTETNDLLYKLESMVQDAVAVIPDDSSVEIKDFAASGASVDAYERYLSYCKGEISVALLGQTLTTEVGDKGSFAAAKTHMQVRGDIVDGDKKIVENTINTLIGWICDVNFPGEPKPVFSMYAPEDVDLDLAERDKVLTDCGVRFTPSYFQREYGLKPEDFSLVAPAQRAEAVPAVPFAGKAAAPAAPALPPSKAEQAVAAAVDSLSPEELQAQADGLLKPVIELIRAGKDANAVLSELAAVWPKMDDSALEEMLTRAYFVMDMLATLQKKS
jgi:phage gp29-like protein